MTAILGSSAGYQRSDARERLQVGALGALAIGGLTSTPSWVPNGLATKGVTAGIGAGIGFATGLVGEHLAQALDDHTALNRWQSHAVETGLGVAAIAATHGHGELGTAAGIARSAGLGLAIAGGSGLSLDAFHGLRHDGPAGANDDEKHPTWVKQHEGAIAIGAGVLAGVALLGGLKFVTSQLKNARKLAPVSPESEAMGKALGEVIPRSKIGTPGRILLENRIPELPNAARSYVPMKLDGKTTGEINQLVVDGMAARGDFSKASITIGSTTGSGGFNLSLTELDERMRGGDTAWAFIQYSDKPSIFSLGKTQAGADSFLDFAKRVAAKKKELFPDGGGPELYGAATSLGAHTVHEAILQHGDELFGPEINMKRMVLMGSPEKLSKFNVNSLGAGEIGRFHDVEDIKKLTPAEIDKMKVLEYAHKGDPVRSMSFDIAWKEPGYLRGVPRLDGVPAGQKYIYGGTFVQQAVDVVGAISHSSSADIAPRWHDYRGDMQWAARAGFGHQATVSDATLAEYSKVGQERASAMASKLGAVMKGKRPGPQNVARALVHGAGGT